MQLHSGVANPFWTLGGGTVLMLRYAHRRSKDIDIFVPDPQYLGFVTPRLSEAAAAVSTDYVESANFVKLIRNEGEIDFVASPNLTYSPFETWDLLGRPVRVETATEIVAKKLWHRGDMATARDLFDLALVIDKEPDQLRTAAPFLTKHSGVFLDQLDKRHALIRAQFEAIDTLTFKPSFEHAFTVASQFLRAL
jgi:predicted nucleotidyltransferase component of viral defense system